MDAAEEDAEDNAEEHAEGAVAEDAVAEDAAAREAAAEAAAEDGGEDAPAAGLAGIKMGIMMGCEEASRLLASLRLTFRQAITLPY